MNSPNLTADQAKQRAYAIKDRLKQLGNSISLTHAYELLAASSGYRNWPTMKAALQDRRGNPAAPVATPSEPGNLQRIAEAFRQDRVVGPGKIVVERVSENSWKAMDPDVLDPAHRFRLETAPVARRWHRVTIPPAAGGTYVVGGYVDDGVMPRHFERTFASVILTTYGPEWRYRDDNNQHVPIEYWLDTGFHPESKVTDNAHIVFLDKWQMQEAVADLEEIRKLTFGDVGDEPDIYAVDYDRLSDLAGKMRKAVTFLRSRLFEPSVIRSK